MRLCVVLAGGAGRRMGGRKPQRLYQGRSLGEQALALAAGFGDQVALSVRDHAQAEGLPPVPLLFDPADIEGPLAGVVSSLDHAVRIGAAQVLTIPCDTPHLPDDLFLRLDAALADFPEALAASAHDGERDQPVCALWRAAAITPVRDYARSGRRSLRGLLQDLQAPQVIWDDPNANLFLNLNTPRDLQADSSCGQGGHEAQPEH
ncbi:molybdenum cofactor guanylyltransferase [Phenylobacterium sp.]|uniref:molybdenum cofactor guanylyltransferase n=1 Tax=Phenylobacterium sp. TaxID=1871053 RepID=UPI002FD96BA5